MSPVEPALCTLPGGTYLGGGWTDETHWDTLTLRTVGPFQLGKYLVIQAEWLAVMGQFPVPQVFSEQRMPVHGITMPEARDFAKRLGELTQKPYRLPTSDEWEFAARGQSEGKWYCGSDVTELTQYAWFDANSSGRPRPVGELLPNSYGLYDMLGNLCEWVTDSPKSQADSNSRTRLRPGHALNRGGSFNFDAQYLAISYLNIYPENLRSLNIGLRIACDA